MRKVIVYIAASVDGYIAKPNDDLEFLSVVHKEGEDYGYTAFLESVDTIIIGRKTYDWVLNQVPEFPHSDKQVFVITRTEKPAQKNITFYAGDLQALIRQLQQTGGKHIFIDGGAMLVNALMQLDLIDEYIISIIPILVGDGIKLFNNGRPEHPLQLVSVQHFDTGLVQLHYIRNRN